MRRSPALLVGALLLATLPLPARAAGPPYNTQTHERIAVAMRDGVTLSVDIWRPVTGGTPVPVILTLSPYHMLEKAQDRNEEDVPADYLTFVRAGYAYARADVRGTYNSGGCWDYGGLKERQDGYDLVEWLAGFAPDGSASAAAAWSTGKVGMIGASYDGTTANAAAVEAPPHLAAIVPISSISRWWGYAYQQGTRALYSGESADADPPSDTPTDFMFAYGGLPPIPDAHSIDQATEIAMRWNLCDRVRQTLHGYSTQPDIDAFWIERDYLRLAGRVKAPALVAHGFLDFNVKTWEGTAWYQALPGEKMLVAGQWPHALPTYGLWTSVLKKWFARWLLGDLNGIEDEPPVRVGANSGGFVSLPSWGDGAVTSIPLSGAPFTYLDDGTLTESEMLRSSAGARALRLSVPGTAGAHLRGRPVLHLAVTSDQPSTHFVATLCSVGADGVCTVITRAFANARYRGGREIGEDLVPGVGMTVDLEFIDKDFIVSATHHLELFIASSSTTWVVPDERRAMNTITPGASSIDLPLV